MSDKFKDKKNNITNAMKRNRDKFIKPLITDEDVNDDSDVFFSVVKNRTKQEKKDLNKSSYYVSPMRGKVEDRSTFPVTSSRGKIDKQYDFIRRDKKTKQEEYKEFKLLDNKRKNQEIVNSHKNGKIEETVKKEEPKVDYNQSYQSTMRKEEPKEPKKDDNPYEENKPKEVRNVKKPEVNIIYEEDIEIDEKKNIITSYDDENHATFFSDYDDLKTNQNSYQSVNVYHHDDKRQGLKEELKKLFAEDEYIDHEEVHYKDQFTQDKKDTKLIYSEDDYEEEYEEEYETPKRERPNFVNLKEELDEELKRNLNKKQKEVRTPQDLAQYEFPPMDLLKESTTELTEETEWIENQMQVLDATLESFGIGAKTVNYTIGPSVIRFEIEPDPGTKVSRITALQDDIKLRLAASDIRIEAPISGKSTVGVEVPNRETRMVTLREILESVPYKSSKSPLKIALGLDIAGEPIFSDIGNMTHSLIAGSTGSGKSVCVNCVIISLLYHVLPDEVKLVLIDPKKVEFSMYRDIPHLLTPVINDPKIATATLRWLTEEMDRRYELIESVGARDIKSYNIKRNTQNKSLPKLPYIVVIIDELADLMVIAASEVEEYIQRISQLARAAGIHLIVATQRPSTNVITGTIKTNIPTRISFKVASSIDSRIILDDVGAEKLLGKGDMLLYDNSNPQLKRLQGSFVSDEEIEKVTNYVKQQLEPDYAFTSLDLMKKETDATPDYDDELFDDACRYVISLGEASASKIQRQFKVGYNRAARMIDMMEKYNIVGPQLGGSKPREVLMTLEEYEALIYSS